MISAGYTVSLTQLGSTLSVIDVLASLATVASDSDYNCPILEPLGFIKFFFSLILLF